MRTDINIAENRSQPGRCTQIVYKLCRASYLKTEHGQRTTDTSWKGLEHPWKNLERSKQSWNITAVYQVLTPISPWNKPAAQSLELAPANHNTSVSLCLCGEPGFVPPSCPSPVLRSFTCPPEVRRWRSGGGCLCGERLSPLRRSETKRCETIV
jgi:hypothetical protein